MLLQLEHQCMRFENKGSGKSCGRYIIGHTKERCSCEMDGSVSEACSAVWHTVYTEHYRDHCRVIVTQHCSAAVSVTWSAVSRPDCGRGGDVLCSPLLSSHARCPAPATAALLLPSGLTITTMLFSALIFLASTNQQS